MKRNKRKEMKNYGSEKEGVLKQNDEYIQSFEVHSVLLFGPYRIPRNSK